MKRGDGNKRKRKNPRRVYPVPGQVDPVKKQQNRDARTEANEDIKRDGEFAAGGRNDDLDEGESARLGQENTDLM